MAVTIDLTPSSKNFGSAQVGGADAPQQEFTVTNTGTDPAPIGGFSDGVLLSTGTQFSIVEDNCSGKELGENESCTVTVEYDPTAAAIHNDVLTVRGGGYWQKALQLVPVAHYRLIETSSNFLDSVSGQVGTVGGGMTRGVTPGPTADGDSAWVDLNGSTGNINLGDVYDFAGDTSFAFAFWFMIDGPGTGSPRFLSKEGATPDGYRIYWNSVTGIITFDRLNTTVESVATTTAITAGTGVKHHLLAAYDATNHEMWIKLDGVLEAVTENCTVSLPGNTASLRLGSFTNGAAAFFEGKLGEFSIYDFAFPDTSEDLADNTMGDELYASAAFARSTDTSALTGAGQTSPVDQFIRTREEPTHEQEGADNAGFASAHNDYVLHGVQNGNFALGPPDPNANLDPATSTSGSNFMPSWRFVQSSNTNITAKQSRDTASVSGSNIKFTFVSGAAADEAFVEQILDIAGSRTRATGDLLRCLVIQGAANTGTFTPFLRSQYLTVDGSITGMPAEAETAVAPAPGTTSTYAHIPGALTGISPPPLAAKLRIRLGCKRGGAANGATGSIDFTDIRRDYARMYVLVAERNSPGVYPMGTITQFDGEIALDPGGSVVRLTDGQLGFPATQNPSSGANVLDDYEEGDWTPTVTFSTPGNLSVSYSVQQGRYTKIGRLVHCAGAIATSAFTHTTASGNFLIASLPFTSANVTRPGTGALTMSGWTSAAVEWATILIGTNVTTALVTGSSSGAAIANFTTATVPTGGTVAINFGFTYTV